MHLPDLLALVLSIKNKAVSVKTIKSSATHGTINIVANRQMAVSDSDREERLWQSSATRDGSSLKCEGLSSRVRIPSIRCGGIQPSIFAEILAVIGCSRT